MQNKNSLEGRESLKSFPFKVKTDVEKYNHEGVQILCFRFLYYSIVIDICVFYWIIISLSRKTEKLTMKVHKFP